MDILESESTGEGTPQGVVLALVGPESNSPKDQESVRSLRMYNLASLVSLAKYAVVQKVRPVLCYCPVSAITSQLNVLSSRLNSRVKVLWTSATLLQGGRRSKRRRDDTAKDRASRKVSRASC